MHCIEALSKYVQYFLLHIQDALTVWYPVSESRTIVYDTPTGHKIYVHCKWIPKEKVLSIGLFKVEID